METKAMERFLSVVFLLLLAAFQQQALATRLIDSPTTLRLGLTHRDFASNYTRSQAMLLALQRSSQRLSHFQQSISLIAAAASPSSTYKASVAAATGAFIASIALGSPPSSFVAIVDTGSDLVWRQCQPCIACYQQTGSIFSPASSSTYRNASCSDSRCLALPYHDACSFSSSCSYIYQYGDLSYSKGVFAYDTLSVPDISGKLQAIADFGFGCGHDNEGSVFAGAGGVIGLGQGVLSLASQISNEKFSYCLQSVTDKKSESPLFLGPGATISSSKVQSTPLLKNVAVPSLYYVNLRGISVGGKLLEIPGGTFDLKSDGTGGTIIDSGTTLSYLVTEAYTAVLSAFQSTIASKPVQGSTGSLGLCYKSVVAVPSLTFHFQGADLVIPSSNNFISLDGLFCLALGQSSSITIVGNVQQQNIQFLFDRGAQKLSFAPATCNLL